MRMANYAEDVNYVEIRASRMLILATVYAFEENGFYHE